MQNNPSITIASRTIGQDHPPYLIAELSANHNGKLQNALDIVAQAKAAGADAVKLQTYRPDTITLNSDDKDFVIEGEVWPGRTLYDLYQEAHMPWDWHAPLFAHARELGITIFSSPFDRSAVNLLEDLGAPAYKIASFEVIDTPLIRYAASTGQPLIISTGVADLDEIGEAIAAAESGGARAVAILHCVSGYPASASEYNLRTIPDMSARFGRVLGLSDHTLGNATAMTSIAMGASIVEKHFTLDRAHGGPDSGFSLEPDELAALCRDCRTAWDALGRVDYTRTESERGNVKFRRSLYFVRSLRAGDTIGPDAIRSVRPGYGLPPKYFDRLIGRRVSRDVSANTASRWIIWHRNNVTPESSTRAICPARCNIALLSPKS